MEQRYVQSSYFPPGKFSFHLCALHAMDQVMWSFSLFLEAVAILPQLVLLQRTRNIDNLTGQYVLLLGYALIIAVHFQIIYSIL